MRDPQEFDRRLDQAIGPVRNVALERERIAGFEHERVLANPVIDTPFEHVNEFRSVVLETRERFRLVVERDQEWFEQWLTGGEKGIYSSYT